MRYFAITSGLGAALVLSAGCSTSASPGLRVDNPTGSCVAPGSGARRGYATPGSSDVWLPDCQSTLKREYYRVFATSRTSAYVIPRPDGAPELVTVCNTDAHPLRAPVDEYSLCAPATDSATVARINDMLPADALTLTHYMHTMLRFEATEGIPGAYLRPFAIPSDVLDACALHPDALSTELAADCEAERRAVDSGIEGPTFQVTATELARLLNELYGVAGACAPGELAGRVCTQCGLVGGCGQTEIRCTRACTSADCVGASAGSQCMLSVCGPVTGCI